MLMKQLYTLKSFFVVLLMSCFAAAMAVEKTDDVNLSAGVFDTDHITWTLGNGITITQLQGSSGTSVNKDYISSPRVYKGHVLSFTAATGYAIKSVSIAYNGTYYGNSMTAGTEYNTEKKSVTDDQTNIERTWSSSNGGTHVVSAKADDGVSQLYIQNVASSANVQLRFTKLTITYIAPSGDLDKVTFTIGNPTVGVGRTLKIDDDAKADYTGTKTYKSSDESIATVSDGVITGVKAGSIKITATAGAVDGSYAENSNEFDVTVVNTVVDLSYGIEIKNFTSLATTYGTGSIWTDFGEAGWWFGEKYMQSSTATLQMQQNAGTIQSPTYKTSDGYEVEVTYSNAAKVDEGSTDNQIKFTFDGGEAQYAVSPAKFTTTSKEAGFTIQAGKSGTTYVQSIKITPVGAISTPVISLEDGYYVGTQSVTITCATEGAKIYYTLDGTTPSATSTEYTGAVSVSETATLKAIAIADGKSSGVASASITILTAYTSIKAICADTTKTDMVCAVAFDGWLVNAATSSLAFIQDANGDYARINASSHGFVKGDKISGTVIAKAKNYYGILEISAVTKSTEGISVTQNNATTPIETTLASITAADYGKLVTVKNVKISQATYKQGETMIVDGETTAVLYNTFGACSNKSFSTATTYNITGIVIIYNGTVEISPRSAEDIASNLKTPNSSWDKTFETVKVGGTLTAKFTTDSNGAVSYESSDTDVIDYDPDDGFQILKAGKAVITAKTAESDQYVKSEASITVQVLDDGETYVMWVAKDHCTDQEQMAASYNADDNVTISYAKGSGSSAPKYYTNGEGARIYLNNTLGIDVPEGYAIESIILTFDGSNTGKLTSNVETYTLEGSVGTWTGKQIGGVIFTAGGTARIKTIEVLYTSKTDGASIENTVVDIKTSAIYDITGRRVEKPGKGIYIVNGKKVIFK